MHRETPVQTSLDALLTRYLGRQAEAHAAGVSPTQADVTPYDASAPLVVDVSLAWDEAQVALRIYGEAVPQSVVPNWADIVAGQAPTVALPLATGNFPQRVRDFQQLLHTNTPVPDDAPAVAAGELIAWAEEVAGQREIASMLLAIGALRLARQFACANEYVARHETLIAHAWRAAWDNEKAALAWHAGDLQAAVQNWERLEPTPAVLFNRGMAHLFLGQPGAARAELQAAATALSGYEAWQHLAQLYLELANGSSLAG
jgi:hypothetical protein